MKISQLKLPGLRIFKTALAIQTTILLCEALGRPTPFFACIGAVVAVESSFYESIQQSIIRNVGTFVGGVVGVIVSMMTTNNYLLGLGIIPVIYILVLLKSPKAVVPGSIVFFAVVFLNATGQEAFIYGSQRIIETFFGSLIGIAINMMIFPPKGRLKHPERYQEEV